MARILIINRHPPEWGAGSPTTHTLVKETGHVTA